MYSAWIKINQTLPWIELEGTFRTESEARKIARQAIRSIRIRIVNISEKGKREKALVTVKTTR